MFVSVTAFDFTQNNKPKNENQKVEGASGRNSRPGGTQGSIQPRGRGNPVPDQDPPRGPQRQQSSQADASSGGTSHGDSTQSPRASDPSSSLHTSVLVSTNGCSTQYFSKLSLGSKCAPDLGQRNANQNGPCQDTRLFTRRSQQPRGS